MALRLPEHHLLKMEVLRWPAHHFSEPKGVRFRGGGVRLSVWVLSHCRTKACPRLGGSAFFESGQRDLGVSSKAHKFACELRALLASDKHLGSAERSERQVCASPPQTRQRVPEALWRIYGLPPLPPTHRGIVRLGSGRAVGGSGPVLDESEQL